jgi:hypothetical protein
VSVFRDMIGLLFDSEVAEDATYTPPGGGDAVDIRVVPVLDDEIIGFGQTRVQAGRGLFRVTVAQLDDPPEVDGVIGYATKNFRIKALPRCEDPLRLEWTIEAYEE